MESMKPRSLTPLCWMPRSSRRSTAWRNTALDTAKARWCTQPGSVGVRSKTAVRCSLVKTVISRPSPGSKYRWPSSGLSRLGWSKTNGMPSTPSQKSIDVRRSAPTIVMWWTPWLWSLRISGRSPLGGRLELDEFRLVLAALQGAPGNELDARLHDERRAQLLVDRVGEGVVGAGAARELDAHRQRRLLLDAGRAGADQDVAADLRREAAHHLAHRRGEHVDAAHDEHVVGPADAPHARAGPPARARTHAHDDVVARAEAQERRRAVAQVGQDELAFGAVLQGERVAGGGVDELGVDVVARAEVHAGLLLALAPERHADVADAHGLGHACAPAVLEPAPARRRAAARLARDEDAPDARRGEVHAAVGRPFDQVRRVRRRQHRRLGLEQLDRAQESLGVAGADRDVAEADALERGQRRARGERPGVVGRDDPLAGLDAGRGVAARRARDPVLDVGRRQRDVARRAGRPARRVDPRDLLARRAEVRADRVF